MYMYIIVLLFVLLPSLYLHCSNSSFFSFIHYPNPKDTFRKMIETQRLIIELKKREYYLRLTRTVLELEKKIYQKYIQT